MPLPMYLDIRLMVATGIKDSPEEDWLALMEFYKRRAASIDFRRSSIGFTSAFLKLFV